MPESDEEAEKRTLRELEGKNVAHYSVLLSAWIDTRMERDKTLVALSAGAIGLLVTILTTVGVRSFWEITFFGVAVISFVVTIWSSLTIYQLNSVHLEEAIRGSSQRDPRLKKYDKLSFGSFVLGISTSILIGILSASYQLKLEDRNMTDKDKSSQGTGKRTTLKESVDGVTKLSPTVTVKKSLDGVTNLNPQATQQTNKPTQQPAQTQGNSSSESNANNSGSGNTKK